MSKITLPSSPSPRLPPLRRRHVTLEKREAPVGSYYKAVFAVPHGCAGSATVKLRVQIPKALIGIKPMRSPLDPRDGQGKVSHRV